MTKILVPLVAALFTQQAAPPSCRIAGVLIDAAGGPARHVRVALAAASVPGSESAMITGADGRFHFDGLPAGKFQLTAVEPDGMLQAYGQTSLGSGFDTSIVTGPGLRTDNLVFRLIAHSTIHGRVTDDSGEPVGNALVQLLRGSVLGGRRSVFLFGSRYTGDRGEYRFAALPAGSYFVAVTGRPWYAGRLAAAQPLARLGYAATFYPNTTDPRAAAPLRLRAGQEAVADFSLTATPGGSLTVGITGGGNAMKRVDLLREGFAGSRCYERVEQTAMPRVSFGGIQPGTYTVQVRTTDSGKPLYGRQTVTVGTDGAAVDIALRELPSVAGRVIVDGGRSPIPDGTVVGLDEETERRPILRAAGVEGSFLFDAVPPGRYRPILAGSNPPPHLRGVTLDGVLSKDGTLEITGPAKLELAATLAGGAVSGVVLRGGEPLAGVLVELAPRQDSPNPYDYLAFQSDSDGSFEFNQVPPGDYVLFAVEDFDDFEYANPEAVRPHLASGRAIRVEGDQKQSVRLEVK